MGASPVIAAVALGAVERLARALDMDIHSSADEVVSRATGYIGAAREAMGVLARDQVPATECYAPGPKLSDALAALRDATGVKEGGMRMTSLIRSAAVLLRTKNTQIDTLVSVAKSNDWQINRLRLAMALPADLATELVIGKVLDRFGDVANARREATPAPALSAEEAMSIRDTALEKALRSGCASHEVLGLAKQFEAYLTGVAPEAAKP